MLTDFLNILLLLDSAVNLPSDLCDISHHTCNMSLHHLVKNNIKNRKILIYLIQYHCFALLLTINQTNLIVYVLLSQIKC